MIVRALAVKQPWAGLIANGAKEAEWRTWSTAYRGPVLIVASLGRDAEGTRRAVEDGELTETDTAKGQAICVVDLVDVVWDDVEVAFGWWLKRPRLTPRLNLKGKLNLYHQSVPDDWAKLFVNKKRGKEGPVRKKAR